jgi:DNA-binding CsgD family transcriptional regulator
LAAFLGGFDLDGAQAVAAGGDMHRYQVLDLLTLLVDKSLVVADGSGGATRYRLLETVRQYAAEKLGESGEADAVRSRHCDHYVALAATLDESARTDYERLIEQAEIEIDNLRAAFAWSRENADSECALGLASSLQPLWATRGRVREGLAWLDAAFADVDKHHREAAPGARARALADQAMFHTWVNAAAGLAQAEQALAIARGIDDPALLARALTACASVAVLNDPEAAPRFFAEAIALARALDDRWRLSQLLGWQALAASAVAGKPRAARAAAEEGRDLAEAIGDGWTSRQCRFGIAYAELLQGDPARAAAHLADLAAEAEAAHDEIRRVHSLAYQAQALAWRGDLGEARAAAAAAVEGASELGGFSAGIAHAAAAVWALAAGDVAKAQEASQASLLHLNELLASSALGRTHSSQAALAGGDLKMARQWADDAGATTAGSHRVMALLTSARVARAEGETARSERDAHDALAGAAELDVYLFIPDILECLGALAGDVGSQPEAARLFGAAEAIRQRIGVVRFKVWDADYEASAAVPRDTLGDKCFDAAWAEGAALSADEAIAYARRGRGERKRPASGWASLTPAERDVVRLVSEGLGNSDIATRLFVSPRTVQSHLTHVYAKLGLTSRVQLAQQAARHT